MENNNFVKNEQDQNKTNNDGSIDSNIRKFCKSGYYIGRYNKLKEYCEQIENCKEKGCTLTEIEKKFKRAKEKIRLTLKNYLELNNVSFLFGAGSSKILGAVTIRDIPEQIEKKIMEDKTLYDIFIFLIQHYQSKYYKEVPDSHGDWKIVKDSNVIYRWAKVNDSGTVEIWGNIATPLEEFTDYLLALEYISCNDIKISDNIILVTYVSKLINLIKKELFKLCDLKYDQTEIEYHKKLIKSLLGRPLNLRRANIFTTNYDLAFEDAFEELGVHYINGFCGFNKRYFRPEIFDYDMYYPGNLTEGKVNRVEKVIRYFKLHGSITWVRENISGNNVYGLRELPIEYIRQKFDNEDLMESGVGDIIIYPTSYKKGYTLDFPYSELFRQFASAITQPQSVLFCIGYSFFDEHINDIIYQALSIPSFTLIIVDLNGNKMIDKLKELNDPRIIVLEGEYLGDFKIFSDEIMPNFHELDIEEKISNALNKIYFHTQEGEKNHG